MKEDASNELVGSFLLLSNSLEIGWSLFSSIISLSSSTLTSSTSSSQVSCVGYSDGSASVVITNGVVPYSYVWNNGMTTSNISNLMIHCMMCILLKDMFHKNNDTSFLNRRSMCRHQLRQAPAPPLMYMCVHQGPLHFYSMGRAFIFRPDIFDVQYRTRSAKYVTH